MELGFPLCQHSKHGLEVVEEKIGVLWAQHLSSLDSYIQELLMYFVRRHRLLRNICLAEGVQPLLHI